MNFFKIPFLLQKSVVYVKIKKRGDKMKRWMLILACIVIILACLAGCDAEDSDATESTGENDSLGTDNSAGTGNSAGTDSGAGTDSVAGTDNSAGADSGAGTDSSAGTDSGASTDSSAETDSSTAEDDDDGEEELDVNLQLLSGPLGILNGAVLLSDDTEEYSFYFANKEGVLPDYTEIGHCADGCFELDDAVIPPYATEIHIYKGEELKFTFEIPEEYLLSDEELFIFGVLSDVHYNRYYHGEVDDAEISFDLALDYFEKIGVEFVGIAGDITTSGQESAFIKYNEAIKNRPFKIYTVTGNHDVTALENGVWKEQITSGITDGAFAPNGLDFVYAPSDLGGDVFVFLNQVRWDYNTEESYILEAEQLEWLEAVLEENKDRTVYLFFHTFLCGPDGEKHTGVGNIMNPGGYTYPLPYTYGNDDEAAFRQLMTEYKNVVYFSGHSHWMFEMDAYGDNTNYSDFDGEYCHMVHVPSVTEPRYIEENDVDRTGKNGESSQGWVAYDYGDSLVLVPIDFMTGVIYTERMVLVSSAE